MDEEIRETQPVFDKTPDFGRYMSLDSTNTAKKRKEPFSKGGKEKVVEVESRRRPFIKSDSKKKLVDAMEASAESSGNHRRKRTFKVSRFQILLSNVLKVSSADSEEGPDKEIVLDLKQNLKRKSDKKKPKGETKPGGAKEKGKRKKKEKNF